MYTTGGTRPLHRSLHASRGLTPPMRARGALIASGFNTSATGSCRASQAVNWSAAISTNSWSTSATCYPMCGVNSPRDASDRRR